MEKEGIHKHISAKYVNINFKIKDVLKKKIIKYLMNTSGNAKHIVI